MSNIYKQFLVDVIVRAYQIIFAVVVVTPIAIGKYDKVQIGLGSVIVIFLLFWAGSIASKMEGKI